MVVKNEMKDLVAKKEKQQEANECSKSVASLYNGKPCMETEYPTPLRGMASYLTTNIRLSVTQRQTLSNRAL